VFKHDPTAKLLIVGDGPQLDDVRKYIQNIRLTRNIILLGRVEHSDLIKSGIFGATDLFVTASETENQPMTILEAQANGIPCVGLSEKGIPDLIKDGKNGFVVPNRDKDAFSDAVIKIISDSGLRKRLRAGTLDEIKKHSLPEVIEIWEKTYESLIKNNISLKNKKRKYKNLKR
jgi:glycosyltransferase involved in cell wall biosynthesis